MKSKNVVMRNRDDVHTIPQSFFLDNCGKIFKYNSPNALWDGCLILILDSGWQSSNVAVTICSDIKGLPHTGTLWQIQDFYKTKATLEEVEEVTLSIG